MANQAIWNKTKFCSGDTVAVHHKVKEGNKERVQIFEGIVISINGAAKSFTVRKTSAGIGVERIWPLLCPSITKIQIKKKGKVRRAKLYYLRKQVGKKILKTQEVKDVTKSTEKKAGSVRRTPRKATSSK